MDGIRHIVYCAAQKQLIRIDDDPSCVERFQTIQNCLEHLIDDLTPVMGKHQLASLLRDVADRLHEEDFEGCIAGLMMNLHITDADRARASRDRKWKQEDLLVDPLADL